MFGYGPALPPHELEIPLGHGLVDGYSPIVSLMLIGSELSLPPRMISA
jgi:hypothetical protein